MKTYKFNCVEIKSTLKYNQILYILKEQNQKYSVIQSKEENKISVFYADNIINLINGYVCHYSKQKEKSFAIKFKNDDKFIYLSKGEFNRYIKVNKPKYIIYSSKPRIRYIETDELDELISIVNCI